MSMAQSLIYESHSEADTHALGLRLGALLPDGIVVALNGPLGAGKTRLVQAIAAARGIDARDVVSPTYTLVQEYRGPRPVFHFDAYRLHDDDEFLNLGPEEYFVAGGVTIIEWAEKVQACLPREFLQITIRPFHATGREFTFLGHGTAADEVVRQLKPAPETLS
ncbi:MAG: tRNA (adenosine(37)-N6)-threonylcarbamoyltransferase complex ATPase subunit type 1 TsaE [Planctomycetia bacterium]|nr:tRNA (adenosine(37)-N6)-threonylcarbamoyltransferase complex ATPase subunit type 1 TsaE [Planctomycetia bacterium]